MLDTDEHRLSSIVRLHPDFLEGEVSKRLRFFSYLVGVN
jgi:hypothetical protein